MPFKLGTPELIILLVILIVLFGVGRIGKLGAELGKGIRELRRGLTADDDEEEGVVKQTEKRQEVNQGTQEISQGTQDVS